MTDAFVEADQVKSLKMQLALIENELDPLRQQVVDQSRTINRLEYELQAAKRSESTKIDELTKNFSAVQSLHRLKCKEVEDLKTEQETYSTRLDELEKGRDTFRGQYLELREINKELTSKVKA